MKKIVLTEEVVKSLNFLIDGAMRFYGFPSMSAHQEIITKAIVDDCADLEPEKEKHE